MLIFDNLFSVKKNLSQAEIEDWQRDSHKAKPLNPAIYGRMSHKTPQQRMCKHAEVEECTFQPKTNPRWIHWMPLLLPNFMILLPLLSPFQVWYCLLIFLPNLYFVRVLQMPRHGHIMLVSCKSADSPSAWPAHCMATTMAIPHTLLTGCIGDHLSSHVVILLAQEYQPIWNHSANAGSLRFEHLSHWFWARKDRRIVLRVEDIVTYIVYLDYRWIHFPHQYTCSDTL